MEAHPGGRSPAPMRGSFPPLGQATATTQASQPQAEVTPRRAKKGVGGLGSSVALRMGSGGQCCQAQPPGSRSHLWMKGTSGFESTIPTTPRGHDIPSTPFQSSPHLHTHSPKSRTTLLSGAPVVLLEALSLDRRAERKLLRPMEQESRTPSLGGGSDPYQRLHTRLPSPACVRAQVQRLECPGPAVASGSSGVPMFFLQWPLDSPGYPQMVDARSPPWARGPSAPPVQPNGGSCGACYEASTGSTCAAASLTAGPEPGPGPSGTARTVDRPGWPSRLRPLAL